VASLLLNDDELTRLAAKLAPMLVTALRTANSDASGSRWLTSDEAARHLRMSVNEVQRAAASGALPAHQAPPGARLYFRLDELDSWRVAGEPGRPRRAPSRAR